MSRGIAVSTVSPQAGGHGKDPMWILLEAIRQGDRTPTALEQRQVVIQLLSEHGIRIHAQDPIFELADAYGRYYRKLASETIASAREDYGKKSPTISRWMVATGVGSAAWAAGLVTGPLLFMRQVDPRYATVGLISVVFGGLVVGVTLWLLSRIEKTGGDDVSG